MDAKGNQIENWDDQYKILGVTYTEKIDTPVNLELMYEHQFVHRHIMDYLSQVQNPKVIEVGCGGARNSLYLALRGFDVTCSDFSPEGIRLAKANFDAFGTGATFLLDDLMNSKIPENSFDCAMSFGLLEHFQEMRPVIKNLTRLVKPGGIQIHLIIPKKFSTQTISNLFWFPAKFLRNITKGNFHNIIRKSYRDFPHYENSFSCKEYCNFFKSEGNIIIRCEPGSLMLPLIMLPFGLGKVVVKLFHKQIRIMNDLIRCSTHPFVYFFAPAVTVVCRKE